MNNAILPKDILASAILIVDDNPANVELLREILRHQGYTNIHSVTDSRLVAELCRTQDFDVLLLDIRMPHFSGFQVIEQLAPIFGGEYVPILVLTAQTDQATRRRALELGATDFLSKPFVTWELLQRLRNILQIRALYKEVRSQNRELEQRVAERTTELTEALAVSRKADRSKLDFLAVMSHELRTPLNSIIGFAEFMQNQSTSRYDKIDTTEYAKLIEESGKHLLKLVNRILDVTKGATGTLSLDESDIDLRRLIQVCAAGLQPKAEANGIAISLLPGAACQVRGDERRLRELMSSLLDNAIKFNHSGGNVTIGVATTEDEFVVEVSDDGPGIPPDLRAHVFDPFTQGEGSLRRRFEGIGLGLPLVQRFAELHGGRVVLDSTLGQGTVVRVFLPRQRLVSGTIAG
ncbi:MAG: response regulator [Azospirillum sp.]|nr:response regulator [Azospirillum sp.]